MHWQMMRNKVIVVSGAVTHSTVRFSELWIFIVLRFRLPQVYEPRKNYENLNSFTKRIVSIVRKKLETRYWSKKAAKSMRKNFGTWVDSRWIVTAIRHGMRRSSRLIISKSIAWKRYSKATEGVNFFNNLSLNMSLRLASGLIPTQFLNF